MSGIFIILSSSAAAATAEILFHGLTGLDEVLLLGPQEFAAQGRFPLEVFTLNATMKTNLLSLKQATAFLHTTAEAAQQTLKTFPFLAFNF